MSEEIRAITEDDEKKPLIKRAEEQNEKKDCKAICSCNACQFPIKLFENYLKLAIAAVTFHGGVKVLQETFGENSEAMKIASGYAALAGCSLESALQFVEFVIQCKKTEPVVFKKFSAIWRNNVMQIVGNTNFTFTFFMFLASSTASPGQKVIISDALALSLYAIAWLTAAFANKEFRSASEYGFAKMQNYFCHAQSTLIIEETTPSTAKKYFNNAKKSAALTLEALGGFFEAGPLMRAFGFTVGNLIKQTTGKPFNDWELGKFIRHGLMFIFGVLAAGWGVYMSIKQINPNHSVEKFKNYSQKAIATFVLSYALVMTLLEMRDVSRRDFLIINWTIVASALLVTSLTLAGKCHEVCAVSRTKEAFFSNKKTRTSEASLGEKTISPVQIQEGEKRRKEEITTEDELYNLKDFFKSE